MEMQIISDILCKIQRFYEAKLVPKISSYVRLLCLQSQVSADKSLVQLGI